MLNDVAAWSAIIGTPAAVAGVVATVVTSGRQRDVRDKLRTELDTVVSVSSSYATADDASFYQAADTLSAAANQIRKLVRDGIKSPNAHRLIGLAEILEKWVSLRKGPLSYPEGISPEMARNLNERREGELTQLLAEANMKASRYLDAIARMDNFNPLAFWRYRIGG